MNNLVLVRVAAALDAALSRAVLRDVRQDDSHRFRLLFETEQRGASVIVSLRPELPWVGRPSGKWPQSRPLKQAFAGACARILAGGVVRQVSKHPADRVLYLDFADGHRLVAELATHRANLLLLAADGNVVATARAPRSGRQRQGIGEPYRTPSLPTRLIDPFSASPAELDALVERYLAEGESVGEILRRRVFGLGAEGAALVLMEAARGSSVGAVVVRRLGDLRAGRLDPVIEAPEDRDADPRDPLGAAVDGRLDRAACRLWPWPPVTPAAAGTRILKQEDAAATAGVFHEALERLDLVQQRWAALRSLVDRELSRLASAASHARRDMAGFSDPDRHRRFGEALLAGLSRARVAGGVAHVPDPYAVDGSELAVPVPPGASLAQAANAQFERHRRALRGVERAERRVGQLEQRRADLAQTQARYSDEQGFDALVAMERELREQKLPVGLEPATRAGRAAHRVARPRLEGVRVLVGRGGATILVGKGARENDRLTFRLASPEDLWFHAQGHPGAHVVLRAPEPGRKPDDDTVREAAAVAAWYSDARDAGLVDVQWTRRKYVRRRRGAPPGAVILKKFQTVRVRPALPPADS